MSKTTRTRTRTRNQPKGHNRGKGNQPRGRRAGHGNPSPRGGGRRALAVTPSRLKALVASAVIALIALPLLWVLVANFGLPASKNVSGVAHEGVRAHLVAQAPTANDSAVELPASVVAQLREIGMANGRIALSRVDSTGVVETVIVDLTPRASDKPGATILKVKERALAKVDEKIAVLVDSINNSPSSTGSRALYQGLLKTEFAREVPIIIVASLLDLEDPVDARKLGFDVALNVVAGQVSDSGELPDMASNPVTFVQVPPAGSQEQLRHSQKSYMSRLWRKLLTAGQASSVKFVDAVGLPPVSTVPAPSVPLPELPGTPENPSAPDPDRRVCELAASTYFEPDKAKLIDPAKATHSLADCVDAAGHGGTVELDAWTSYYGPLDASGKPARNPESDLKLSTRRARVIAKLMVSMGLDPSQITRITGHGNDNQPDPDPTSANNRVVLITIHKNTDK